MNTDPSGESAANCGIWQFTSEGHLSGYNGNLDMNYLYKDVILGGDIPTPQPTPVHTVKGSILELAAAVMRGEYGDDQVRKNSLGNRYNEVQDFINHIYNASVDTLVAEVKAGKYGNVPIRSDVLGPRFQEVQDKINNDGGSSEKVYIVKPGDILSSIAAKFGTTYQKIARDNNISNPDLIYPGQKLIIK